MQGGARLSTFTAFLTTATIVVAFTVGKAFVTVPGVWEAQAHQVSELRLNPLDSFFTARVWWGPWLNLAGNVALFLPVGYILYRGSVARAAAWGFLLSLGIETAQYIWALGYSDTDDLLFNTLGAALGAWVAARHKTSTMLWLITALNIVVLVPYLALARS